MTTLRIEGESYEGLVCCTCGIKFLMPLDYVVARRDRGEAGRSFYCPNGHQQTWRESELDRVRRERDIAKQQVARAEQEARDAQAEAMRQEKIVRRLKKRTAVGVCPCCNRTFGNMAKHMRTKHPTFAEELKPKVVA